jgi:hypothetical protein
MNANIYAAILIFLSVLLFCVTNRYQPFREVILDKWTGKVVKPELRH